MPDMNVENKNHTQIKAGDWRQQLKINQKKTRNVIALFILIYLSIGFLVDLFINRALDANQFKLVFQALITFQIIPMATITMAAVAAISLWVTYAFHDRLMLLGTEYHEIKPESARNLQEQQLYHVVEEMKISAGLKYMPKVYLIEADYMNAFASGYSEKSALIAITRGLVEKLDRAELQAVMAHELSHIRHGDIKLTLTASVLSSLMLIVIDILFYNMIFSGNRRNNDRGGNQFAIIIILLRYLMPVITIVLMMYLSRAREYMADAGSVELMRDNQPLGRALLKISGDHESNYKEYRQEYGQTKHEEVRRAAYIFDPFADGAHPIASLNSLFATHPPINDRLKSIGFIPT
jgi:heat shock protein HtpX